MHLVNRHSSLESNSPVRDSSPLNNNIDTEVQPLDAATLQLLGVPIDQSSSGENLHQDLEKVWSSILSGGLLPDVRAELLGKYPTPDNCRVLGAPKLNEEVQAIVEMNTKNRDDRLALWQLQIGTGLAAIGKAINILLPMEPRQEQLIELLSDAGRLFADVHHEETGNRRRLIFLDKNVNSAYGEKLAKVPVSTLLFGDDLAERLKSSKELEKSTAVLKTPTNKSKNGTSRHLNWKSLPKSSGGRQRSRLLRNTARPTRNYRTRSQPNKSPRRGKDQYSSRRRK